MRFLVTSTDLFISLCVCLKITSLRLSIPLFPSNETADLVHCISLNMSTTPGVNARASQKCGSGSISGVGLRDCLWSAGRTGVFFFSLSLQVLPTLRPPKSFDQRQRERSLISCSNLYLNRCKLYKI